MPIEGLLAEEDRLSFPEIGHIRKGAPKTEKGYVGRELPYFRVEFNEGEEEAARLFHEAYGDEPTEIEVFFPFNEIDRFWDYWKEAYTAGALIHRCNGSCVQYEIDPQSGEVLVFNWRSVETGERVPCDGSAGCKPVGRLKVIIPALRRLAYLTVHTTSIHDICNITTQLRTYQQMADGHLVGIPFVLRRVPKEISTWDEEKKCKVRYRHYLISIEIAPRWVGPKMAELARRAFPKAAPETPQLPPAESGAEAVRPSRLSSTQAAHDGEEVEAGEVRALPSGESGPSPGSGEEAVRPPSSRSGRGAHDGAAAPEPEEEERRVPDEGETRPAGDEQTNSRTNGETNPPDWQEEAQALREHMQKIANASPGISDPASDGMLKSVKTSLERRYGEGAAEKIAEYIFDLLCIEELTQGQAIALQNELTTAQGVKRWGETVKKILAFAPDPEWRIEEGG